jgi:acyl-CoA synthetase (AMP-forming)/AMP-acid ligase II
MNLGRYVSRSARYFPDNIALRHEGKTATYKEFEKRTNRLANGLMDLGLSKGDGVAICSWNRGEIAEIETACYKAGLVRIPLNARLAAAETVHVLNDAGARAVVADPQHQQDLLENRAGLESVAHIICLDDTPAGEIGYEALLDRGTDQSPDVEVAEDDLAVLAYSSGTTGKLKAIMQSFGNRLASMRKLLMIPEMRLGEDTIFCHTGPITHASGMWLLPVMFRGGCNLVLNRFDVQMFLETIQREKVTNSLFVPTMISMILEYPQTKNYDLGSLRGLIYGGAPTDRKKAKAAIDALGPVLIQCYGMTETTAYLTCFTIKEHLAALVEEDDKRFASCGRPFFDTEVKVVDESGQAVAPGEIGEMIARGPDLMKGYFKAPELTGKTIRDGWIHSGDLARVDDRGYIYIVDRVVDKIITGGFNVYPTEVEQILCSHPSVSEACVVGIPDEKWGEAVKAVVVLKKGAEDTTAEALIDFCTHDLGRFKKPRSVDFVDALPKNANGKVLRRKVREPYWQGRESRVI